MFWSSNGRDLTLVQCALPAAVRNLVLHTNLTPPVVDVDAANLPSITLSSICRTRSDASRSRACKKAFFVVSRFVSVEVEDVFEGDLGGGLTGVFLSIQV